MPGSLISPSDTPRLRRQLLHLRANWQPAIPVLFRADDGLAPTIAIARRAAAPIRPRRGFRVALPFLATLALALAVSRGLLPLAALGGPDCLRGRRDRSLL